MFEFLPEAIRREMEQARKASQRKRTHMQVRAGGHDFTILRYWDEGFALDAEGAPNLRGVVDLYDRGRHMCKALVVTSSETNGERVFEFKITTPAMTSAPPADFVRETPEPVGLIARD